MEISERSLDDVVILDLDGRLVLGDGEKAFRLKVDEVVARGRTKILVNFSDVSHLDSAGLGTIVWKHVTLLRQGGSLKLLNLSPRSYKILSITKLLTVIENFNSETDAIRSFSRTSPST